ncbi:phage shock protein PspA [Halomonas denitrificans]|nr:phage shock protein PspA [Halomonas denitrificans]
MGIFSRLGDIINANLNAALEKAEDPEKMIRLMIQEMEDTLVEIRSATAKCIAEKKERARLLKRLEEQKADWASKAELALDKDREDLARAALAEKTALGDRIEHLEDELSQYDEQLQKYDNDIARLQAKLDDARARQRTIVMRHRSAEHQLKSRRQIHNQKIEEMLHRFDAAERRVDHIESEAEAMDMGRQPKTLGDEFDSLARDDRVEEELESLKASRSGSKSKGTDKESA